MKGDVDPSVKPLWRDAIPSMTGRGQLTITRWGKVFEVSSWIGDFRKSKSFTAEEAGIQGAPTDAADKQLQLDAAGPIQLWIPPIISVTKAPGQASLTLFLYTVDAGPIAIGLHSSEGLFPSTRVPGGEGCGPGMVETEAFTTCP